MVPDPGLCCLAEFFPPLESPNLNEQVSSNTGRAAWTYGRLRRGSAQAPGLGAWPRELERRRREACLVRAVPRAWPAVTRAVGGNPFCEQGSVRALGFRLVHVLGQCWE